METNFLRAQQASAKKKNAILSQYADGIYSTNKSYIELGKNISSNKFILKQNLY